MSDAPSSKRLYLLDGMALIYRAHFALIRSPRYTSGGQCTSAVFGVVGMVFDILRTRDPTHIAVAFDTSEPTRRHREFPEYKAQREAMPEDIAQQIPLVDRFFDAMNIRTIRVPGYEADDIIGTLARQAEEADFDVWMVTPDKDFQQLVTDRIRILRPGRQGSTHEEIGVRDVLEQWQIERVEQVIDILALMGDASDNIPGIPGVGPKTAQKLIARYGSVENLLEHTQELKGKQKQRIEEHAEMARLSRRLVTIDCDVPHQVVIEDLQVRPYEEPSLRALFEELEFDTLGRRVLGPSFSSSRSRRSVLREKRKRVIQNRLFEEPDAAVRTIRDVPHQYHTIRTRKQRKDLIDRLRKESTVCFDTETTSRDPRDARILGLAFCLQPGEAWYVVFPEEDPDGVLQEFRPLFENPDCRWTGHNLKYDLTVLKWHGIEVRGTFFDTMLAHALKEPDLSHGLDELAELYLGYRPIPLRDLIGEEGTNQKEMREVPPEKLAEYACEDADITLQVADRLHGEIERSGLERVCDIECRLLPVLVDMEREGIRIDTNALRDCSARLQADIDVLQHQIHQAAGHEFNIDSPRQLGVVLFDELQLSDNPGKTATGQYSTRESDLERLAAKHEIVRSVLDYRSAVRLKSAYVDQLPEFIRPDTGRIHTHYSQAWAATGRIQSSGPNLQAIPIRRQRGREIRAAFVPRGPDYLILSADYSQIELRIMAELSGDQAMKQAFVNDEDIHLVTASRVFQVDPQDVTREMRDAAKTVNFGILYGISPFGLQQRLNIPRKEAAGLISSYFEKYPGVRKWIDRTIAFAREHGYVTTQTGRRRTIRNITSRNRSLRNAAERLAMNSPVQGTAADLLKLAMIRVHEALQEGGFQTKMLLTVHDELVFDMYRDEQESVVPVIRQCMMEALPMSVPLAVEIGLGENWLQAH